jgi:BON domain-containing protein
MKRITLGSGAGFVLIAVAGLLAGPAHAQTTSTGAFGSRTVGGSSGTSAPRTSTGSSTQSTSANGMTLMQNVDGGVSGGERYVRGNRQGQFVGVGSEDTRAVGVSQAGGGNSGQQFGNLLGGRNGSALGQLLQNSQFNQQGRTQSGRNGTTQLRIPIRLGFNPRPIATSKVTAQLQTRLGRLPALTTVGPIEVALEGEAVVLRGMVASEGDRQLAEELLMLEPEVTLVKNELKVQPLAESNGEALPAPTSANR